MSEVKVNKISPRSGTTVTLGDSGDTFTLASGVSLTGVNATFSGDLTVDTDTLYVDSTNNRVGVGTTSPSVTFDAEADGATVAHFNRATSDGDILELQKDGTTVGSIGTTDFNGSKPFIANPQTNGAGIGFYTDDIFPTNASGAPTGSVVSLGQTSYPFNNLYLSGSAYLGGTTSANALDDYEEGTWTPEYEPQSGSFSAITYNEQAGSYTKIGHRVFFQGRIRTNSITVGTASGAVNIGGLPFTSINNSSIGRNAGSISVCSSFAGDMPSGFYVEINTDQFTLQFRTSANGSASVLLVGDLGTGSLNNHIHFSGSYIVS